jgi:uncharacterized protein YcfJ
LIEKHFGRNPMMFTLDTYADIGSTENVLEREIKKKTRSILLYDVLYKMRQEQERVQMSGKIDYKIDPISDKAFEARS